MADRYENVGRERYRDWDRERTWGRGRREPENRFLDSDRESRGEFLRGDREYDPYDRDRDYDRENERWRSERRYGSERWRDDDTTRNLGGGLGAYSGRDWETRRYTGYGGGMGESSESERDWISRSTTGRYTGRYTGRGPKNYRRTDERIFDEVCERLMRHPDIDASEIEVEVHSGEVTLKGSVGEREQKHWAEDVAERTSGVRDVHNHIKVDRSLGERLSDALGFGRDDREERRRTLNVTGANPELTEERRR